MVIILEDVIFLDNEIKTQPINVPIRIAFINNKYLQEY
jgi:hypothetical protein